MFFSKAPFGKFFSLCRFFNQILVWGPLLASSPSPSLSSPPNRPQSPPDRLYANFTMCWMDYNVWRDVFCIVCSTRAPRFIRSLPPVEGVVSLSPITILPSHPHPTPPTDRDGRTYMHEYKSDYIYDRLSEYECALVRASFVICSPTFQRFVTVITPSCMPCVGHTLLFSLHTRVCTRVYTRTDRIPTQIGIPSCINECMYFFLPSPVPRIRYRAYSHVHGSVCPTLLVYVDTYVHTYMCLQGPLLSSTHTFFLYPFPSTFSISTHTLIALACSHTCMYR